MNAVCPSCRHCDGHPQFEGLPHFKDMPKRWVGDHRPIYDCAFFGTIICVCCYMKHNERHHPELYDRFI